MRSISTLAVLILALAAHAQEPGQPSAVSPRTIRATGDARVSVRPDVAVVTLGVQVVGANLKKAAADGAVQTRAVFSALRKAGVADKDVQTTRHQIEPQQSWQNHRPGPITAYAVTDDLSVTVRELGSVEGILAAVTTAGSNVLRGITFLKEDLTQDRAQTLTRAIANAHLKAEAMAKAAGVQLGELISVSETGDPVVENVVGGMVGGVDRYVAAPPVAVGEIEVRESVEIVFAVR